MGSLGCGRKCRLRRVRRYCRSVVLIPKMASQEAVLRNKFPGSQLPGSSQDVAKPAFPAPSWLLVVDVARCAGHDSVLFFEKQNHAAHVTLSRSAPNLRNRCTRPLQRVGPRADPTTPHRETLAKIASRFEVTRVHLNPYQYTFRDLYSGSGIESRETAAPCRHRRGARCRRGMEVAAAQRWR